VCPPTLPNAFVGPLTVDRCEGRMKRRLQRESRYEPPAAEIKVHYRDLDTLISVSSRVCCRPSPGVWLLFLLFVWRWRYRLPWRTGGDHHRLVHDIRHCCD
jgi:hypothetical protein